VTGFAFTYSIVALQGQLSVEKSNREKTEAFAKQLEQTCAEQMEVSCCDFL
jgi:hypothetical protein